MHRVSDSALLAVRRALERHPDSQPRNSRHILEPRSDSRDALLVER